MKPRHVAAIHFALFLILITAGIVAKRAFGHPEYVIFFHLPAAVFLVLTGMALKQGRILDYEKEISVVRNRPNVSSKVPQPTQPSRK